MRGKGVRFLQGSTLPPNNSLEGTVSGLWMRAAALRDSVRPVALDRRSWADPTSQLDRSEASAN